MHKQVERAFWAQRLETAVVKDMGRQYEVEQEPGDDDFRAVSAVHAGLRGAELKDTSAQPKHVRGQGLPATRLTRL